MSGGIERRQLVANLRCAAPDALMVAGLGSPAWDLAASGDVDGNFYLWGGMGQAVMVALGLALAQPARRVIVITGDGEMLMGMGSLAPVAAAAPANLAVLVLDNETYGETGGQASATRGPVDLVAVAQACGVADAGRIEHAGDVAALVGAPGPVFRLAKVSLDRLPLVLPPRDGAALKSRLRRHLGLAT